MKNVLITGADGLIGKHYQEWFHKYQPEAELTLIDIKSGNDCRHFFASSNQKYDLFIHLAAYIGGRAQIDGAPLVVAENINLDSAAFQWALKTKPHHFIYFSSSAAYPIDIQQTEYKLKESYINYKHIRTPDQTYGLAKLVGEIQADLLNSEGIRTYIFRPFSGYSHLQSLDYPFPSFIKRAQYREDPFSIWGNLNSVRDWIHAEDIIMATMQAIDSGVEGPTNLGWGIPIKFIELAELITKEVGYEPTFQSLDDKPTGVYYRCADPTKMLEFYTPRISLEEGIRRALFS